jgi:hypothetical protein
LSDDPTPNETEHPAVLVVPTPVVGEDVDDLIVELARYCAEVLFLAQFSAEPANDNS